jgi:ketosteroid isomerase-like protein
MQHKAPVVRRFMEILGSGEIASVKEILHPDASLDFPGVRPTRGKAQTALLLRQIFFDFKYLTFEIVDLIEEGEKVCVLWENTGERKDGTVFRNRGATIFHIRDGAIASISDYFKQDLPRTSA